MQQSFAGKLFDTISFTLLHSLWQGLLLTIIVAAMLLATKKSAPSFRYALLTGLLFGFIATVTISFILHWQQGSGMATAFTQTLTTASGIADQNNWWLSITAFINNYSGWMMGLWTAVVLIKLGRMLLDLYYVNRLCSSGISQPQESWINHLQQLSHKMGIHKKIRLFESQLVNIPMVAGHFKPVILLPLGMLSKLSMAEVEAVLLHELAHIRRHDYLVNLLQRITVILFFFNPAVLWLSSLMRAERENCCDAMAIRHSNDKLTFIEALISVKQHAMPATALAMNFLGQKNVLLQRVNRIVNNRNKTLDRAELSFVTVSIIAAGLYFLNVTTTMPAPAQQPLAAERMLHASGLSVAMVDKAAIIATSGSGMPVAGSHTFNNRPVTKKINKGTAATAKKNRMQAANAVAAREPKASMPVNHQEEAYRSPADTYLLQAQKDQRRAELDKQQAERDLAQAALDRKQAETDRMQADKDRAEADKDRAQAALDIIQAGKDRAQAELDRKQAEIDRRQAAKHRAQALPHAGPGANTR